MRRRDKITVAGYGPVGRELVKRLSKRGDQIVVVQREKPRSLPENVQLVNADLENFDATQAALASSDVVVCTVGLPYVAKVWARVWPSIMRNLLDACSKSSARFVFADNLYAYGPQTRPLTEDMPSTTYGQKPRVRGVITRLWQQAHNDGKVKAVAVRAADFYGPAAPTSVLTSYGVVRLLKGKPALSPYPPDNPHDFSYIPDFARALETLIDAPDDAYGQTWHVPNPRPTHSLRELLTMAANMIGVPPRVQVLSPVLATILSLFRSDVRELKEMRYQWDQPFIVDSSKFMKRFWSDPTPFEEGLRSTIEYYKQTQLVSPST